MASVTKGQTFGTTEQITNTKLHNLVDLATIDMTTGISIGTTSPSLGAFTSVTATAFCLTQASKSATAAAAEHSAFILDHYFNLNINGVTLYIPCATATA
jgi:hypothetical protein